jgi:hypothetical protein
MKTNTIKIWHSHSCEYHFLQCGPSCLVDSYQQTEGTSQLQVHLLVWFNGSKIIQNVNTCQPNNTALCSSNIDMEFHCLRHVCVKKRWLYTTITCFQLATYYHEQKICQMTLSIHYDVAAFFPSFMHSVFPLISFFLKIQIIFSENRNHESPKR